MTMTEGVLRTGAEQTSPLLCVHPRVPSQNLDFLRKYIQDDLPPELAVVKSQMPLNFRTAELQIPR